MSLAPTAPRRPLRWPELVGELARAAPDASRLYMVGGMVRDALRGTPIHDFDLATPDNGLRAARQIANAFDGAYYPVDAARHTGRAIVHHHDQTITIDVASFRGGDLLEDLAGRDFNVNAMAVQLDARDALIDPLGGQQDLFDHKLLRQCKSTSITDDPIRALRAVRQALELSLRIERGTLGAVREAGRQLVTQDGSLDQPERTRDELFKMLGGARPAAALRLMGQIGLWHIVAPPGAAGALNERLPVVECLHDLLAIIGPKRDDNTAADLTLGVAVMILDRYRRQLQDFLVQTYADGRSLPALLLLSAVTPPSLVAAGEAWAARLRLSGEERDLLTKLVSAHSLLAAGAPVGDRQAHRYYHATGEAGIGGTLVMLAGYLAAHPPYPDPQAWGALLDEVAAPLLDAFFRRHQQVVAPPPLLDGNDLVGELGLKPGPPVGQLLVRLAEEQAAGEIRTRQEALDLARRLASE